jgi:hypothetical protein
MNLSQKTPHRKAGTQGFSLYQAFMFTSRLRAVLVTNGALTTPRRVSTIIATVKEASRSRLSLLVRLGLFPAGVCLRVKGLAGNRLFRADSMNGSQRSLIPTFHISGTKLSLSFLPRIIDDGDKPPAYPLEAAQSYTMMEIAHS